MTETVRTAVVSIKLDVFEHFYGEDVTFRMSRKSM